MAEVSCATCGQGLAACQCPPPPPPDTLGRAVELQQAARARRLSALMPLLMYAEMVDVSPLVLDEALAHVRTAFFPPAPTGAQPRHARGRYPDRASFLGALLSYVRARYAEGRRPTQARAACQLGITPRHFQRLFKAYITSELGLSWDLFLGEVKKISKVP